MSKNQETTAQKFKKFVNTLKKQERKPDKKNPLVHYVMHRFHKDKDLHIGSSDQLVKDRKQAIAIALNMAKKGKLKK